MSYFVLFGYCLLESCSASSWMKTDMERCEAEKECVFSGRWDPGQVDKGELWSVCIYESRKNFQWKTEKNTDFLKENSKMIY